MVKAIALLIDLHSFLMPIFLKVVSMQKYVSCGALHHLIPFVQFKKREKHPSRSVTFSKLQAKPATLLKVNLLQGVFHVF